MSTTMATSNLSTTETPSYNSIARHHWGYGLLAILIGACLVLNSLVLLSIAKSKYLQRTIFYLLGSLAVADMMQAIFVMMPSLVYVMLDGCWRPKQICFALQGAETVLLAATMAHICLAVCDCHTALLRPLQYQLRQVSAYSTLNIVITWLFAAIMSMPFLVVSGVMPTQEAQEQCTPHACTLMRPEHALAKTGGVLLLPSAILLGLYTCAHRAIVKQQSVITKMQAEVNSGTTSNGDVTGLDHLEHDIASEKTITQTIDICCQLAGVSPISRALTTPDITACPEEIATDSNAPRNEEEEQEEYDRCNQCNGDAQAAGDEESDIESHQRSNSIKCIAQVHVSSDEELEVVESPDRSVDNAMAPVETAVGATDDRLLSIKASDDKPNKKSKEELNAPADVDDVCITTQQNGGSAYDNPGFNSEEDETPLATAIRAVHDPADSSSGTSSQNSSPPMPKSSSSCPPTRQSSQNGELSRTRRSILRRDHSHRTSIPKSVKFSSTVSTKEIKPRTLKRVPTGHRRVQRQGSLKNPHRVQLVRQAAVTESDNVTAQKQVNGGNKTLNGSAAPVNDCTEHNASSLLAGLQMGRMAMNVPEYLAELHQRQGKRMTLRVHRQRSVLRLALLMVCAFLVLVLPNCLAQVVTSVCASCDTSAALSIALQWLSHSSCLINPIIYILATKDFQQSFKELCPC